MERTSCWFLGGGGSLAAGEGLRSAVVEGSMTVEFIFPGDVYEGSELHDLSLVSLMGLFVALQFLLLPAEDFPLRPGLLQQVAVINLQSAVSVLNDRDLRVGASEGGGRLRMFEGSGIVNRVVGEIGGGLWVAPAEA